MSWWKKALKWVAAIIIVVVLVVAVIFAIATWGAGAPVVGAWATAAAGWLSATTMFGVSLATWSIIAGVIGITLGFATGLISINLAGSAAIQGADSASDGSDVNYDTYFLNDPSAVGEDDSGQTELSDDLSGWTGVGTEAETNPGHSSTTPGGDPAGGASTTETTTFEPFDPGPHTSGEATYVDTWSRPASGSSVPQTDTKSGLTTNQKIGLGAAAAVAALLLLGGE